MRPDDPKETFAGICTISEDLGFPPTTTISEDVPKFSDWHQQYHGF